MSADLNRDAALDLDWAETRRRLRAYITRRVGDPNVAEDITHDVIVRSIAAGALERADNPVAWLYRSASNAVIDHYRTHRQHRPLDEGDDSPSAGEDDGGVNDATRELSYCIQPLVDRLDPIYRDALTRVDLDGATQVQAATETGLSLSGMKSRVQRARHQLKRLVTDCCVVETDRAGGPIDYHPRAASTCNPTGEPGPADQRGGGAGTCGAASPCAATVP